MGNAASNAATKTTKSGTTSGRPFSAPLSVLTLNVWFSDRAFQRRLDGIVGKESSTLQEFPYQLPVVAKPSARAVRLLCVLRCR